MADLASANPPKGETDVQKALPAHIELGCGLGPGFGHGAGLAFKAGNDNSPVPILFADAELTTSMP